MQHDIEVLVTKTGRKFEFRPDSHLWRAGDDGYPNGRFVLSKDALRMQRNDNHHIRFIIKDEQQTGLQFPSDPKNAFWVIKGQTCPKASDSSDYSAMLPYKVESRGESGLRNVLWVRNSNNEVQDWSFSLNFVKPGADENDRSKYECWDPITSNQNGGSNRLSRLALGVGIVAVAGASLYACGAFQ